MRVLKVSRMAKIRCISLLAFLLVQTTLQAQTKISNLDLSYWYRADEGLTGKILATKEDSTATLLVRIDEALEGLRKYELSYSLANTLEDEITKRYKLAPITSYFQYEDQASSYFGMRVNVSKYRYIVLWLSDTVNYKRYPFIKEVRAEQQSAEVAFYQMNFNAPIIKNYVSINSEARLRPLDGTRRNLIVKNYDHNFLPALPPMSRPGESDSISFRADIEFNASTDDTIRFEKPGLYYFQLIGAKSGQSVISTNEQYPGTNTFDELVRNLRYLATSDEYEKMMTSFDKKELFDKFWLNNTKSEEKARSAVREYYKRVRNANILFTSYKEGWKTDRGMIYIIFGPPNRVFVKDNSEMWIYEKSFELPRVAFTFSRIDTAFTDEHYVLIRDAEYQNLWFRVVDLWRKGKKEY